MLTMHWQSVDAVVSLERPSTLAKAASAEEEKVNIKGERLNGSKVALVKEHMASEGRKNYIFLFITDQMCFSVFVVFCRNGSFAHRPSVGIAYIQGIQ